jgi:hypothetical protein
MWDAIEWSQVIVGCRRVGSNALHRGGDIGGFRGLHTAQGLCRVAPIGDLVAHVGYLPTWH